MRPARFDPRFLAVGVCGGTAFLDMYATQPLLPALRGAFGASEAAVGATISALTFACALAAPLVGPLADALGRKRVIVGAIFALALVTLAAASASSLRTLIVWRFVQGLCMPAVFAVTLAYVAEEFPTGVGGRAIGAYIGGNVLGGFLGRWIAAAVAARWEWQAAFLVLGGLNLVGGVVVLAALPRARRFQRHALALETLRAMGRFLRRPALLATYVVGANVLFTMTAAFTFATFYLAGPPFGLGTLALGNVFCVYLLGVVATPLAGRLIDHVGHRTTLLFALATSATGIALTLLPRLSAVIVGLALVATGVFAAQAASQGYIGVVARERRSTAAALYLTFYYTAGGLGAIVPAALWAGGGWPATVGLIVAVQLLTALVALFGWRRDHVVPDEPVVAP